MKRCPDCSSPLFRRRAAGIEVDGCNGCGSVWLDGGELRELARVGPESLVEVDRQFRAGLQPIVAPEKTNACPVCSSPLTETDYPGIAGLKIRACSRCKGVALSDGQLSTVAQRLGHEPSAGSAHAAAQAAIASTQEPSPSARTFTAPAAAVIDHHDHTSTQHLPLVHGSALPHVTHSGGFFDRLSRGWTFIKGAYSLAWHNKGLMAPILIGGIAALLFLGINAALFMSIAGDHHGEIGVWLDENRGMAVTWGIVLVFGQQLIRYASMGMCVNMVDAFFKGLPPRLSTASKDVAKNIGGILALAIVGTLIELLTSSLRRQRRRLGSSLFYGFAAGVVESFWTIASYLILPVIIIEDTGLGTGIRRATGMHKGNLMQIAVGEVGIGLVQGLVGLVVGLVVFASGVAAVPTGTAGLVTVVIVAVVLFAILSTVNAFAKATYYTSLYLWTVEVERAGVGSAIVPGPLAHALA